MRFLIPLSLVLSTGTAAGLLVHRTQAAQPAPLFTDAERKALVAFWNAPGRYSITMAPVPAGKTGPWTVRLTPEGSTWFLAYQKAVTGARKVPPSQTVTAPTSGPTADWEPWVSSKLAYDRWQAQQVAESANNQLALSADEDSSGPKLGGKLQTLPAPAAPGPAPAGLVAAAGNPPALASAVVPMQYSVRFDEQEDPFVYTDNVKFSSDRFAYYRFAKGVVSYGKRVSQMPEPELGILFKEAGFSPSERKIFSAVSALEGGFETVQTYDTGYVSVGFIQFVTMGNASGEQDICKVLETEKRENPEAFQQDFRQYGLDIQPDRTLTVVDPATGVELVGTAAVQKIIDDKRLTAIWQRAGRRSAAFKVAQIKIAKTSYWPSADPVSASVENGTTLNGKVSDIVQSEAGIATLLDRKINTGNIRPLNDVVTRLMKAHRCKSFAELRRYERELVNEMKYRTDFLADKTLGQPPALPLAKPVQTTQRESGFSLLSWIKDLFN